MATDEIAPGSDVEARSDDDRFEENNENNPNGVIDFSETNTGEYNDSNIEPGQDTSIDVLLKHQSKKRQFKSAPNPAVLVQHRQNSNSYQLEEGLASGEISVSLMIFYITDCSMSFPCRMQQVSSLREKKMKPH